MGAAVLLLFLCYPLAFAKTLALYKKCAAIEQDISGLKQGNNSQARLKQQVDQLNFYLGDNGKKPNDFQQELVNHITPMANNNALKLARIDGVKEIQEDRIRFFNAAITFEGTFKNILQLVNTLESDREAGRLISVSFFSEKNFKNKGFDLYGTLYFQRIAP